MKQQNQKILDKYVKTNRPFAALFEVTKQCMCQCIHCYLDSSPDNELSTQEINSLFMQMRNLGIVNLGITGGEPFLRDDIFKIIESANKNQFFLSILTTGILLDRNKINNLKKYNVNELELSILGADAELNDRIMNFDGAFQKILKTTELLRKADINVFFKATIIKQNYHQLSSMKKLADSLDAGFSANISLVPKINGDISPLTLSISEKEFKYLDFNLMTGGLIPDDDLSAGGLLLCNAGKITIGVSSAGDIYPCLLFRKSLGNIRNTSLQNILIDNPSSFLKDLRSIKEIEINECYHCTIRSNCIRCPGSVYSETGDYKNKSDFACNLAGLKQKILESSYNRIEKTD